MVLNVQKDSLVTLNDGNKIPVSGFGLYLTPPDETFKLTYEALKAGYRQIDSAKLYDNEKESAEGIAKFLKDFPNVKRSEIFYTTKIFNDAHGYEEGKKGIQESLGRVAPYIDYIDLLLIHTPISNKEKRLGAWKALQEAVESGKVKSIGVSNYGTQHLDELYNWDGLKIKPSINQLELHPWLPRKDLQEYGKKHGFYLQAYAPLTQGQKFKDPDVVAIAEKHGYTAPEVLLAWSYYQGFIPIAKTATVGRIEGNYTTLDRVKLDDEDLKKLDKPESYESLTYWDPTLYKDDEINESKWKI
ncbi:hypothetical protein BN7_1287 [Wickerhamomyces ciferrii]|uniref:NADP-dependent oxidoreductase domain-containing protein n=1 Tax=Wickerhamomyces ciferrii (strain ATCC 14091 / BCRC 22168 / CBS 111 / JCM 3599 / NBRC 0793 / NRRL Y-1031 F-60-10) TaxID=1206466 RepID=K0KKV9_WICCF|nr:uncharacterized protein BN7_1287 [Wickerhamomyces ciferrii]CCH41748.1 hypothetical protein BN7_1287 [Wickerhamomyces ciferrii]